MIDLQSYDPMAKFPKLRFGISPDQEKKLLEVAEKMATSLKQDRNEYEPDWKELAKYFGPALARIDDTTKTKKSKWANIINNTCLRASRTQAAGMQSGLTSPARPWFKVGIEDYELMEKPNVKEWLEVSTKRMQTTFRRSNFYNTSHQIYQVMGIFGTAGQLQLQDFEDILLFKALMTGRYWIGQNARGKIDRIVIMSYMKIHQMVETFGAEKCDPATRTAYDKGDYFMEKAVWIAIFPNPYAARRGDKMIVGSNEKPFVSVYWTEGHRTPLKTSGYDRFPAQVPRWDTTDDEAYGYGLGIMAIGDTKATQLKEREKAKGLQKIMSPPQSAPAEMRFGQYPISGLPGGVTYRPPGTQPDAIKTMYQINMPLQYMLEDIKIDDSRVNAAFFVDLFLATIDSTRRQVTATEIAERHEEKLLALGPVIERLSNEYLDPNIERAFEIMFQHEELPPPPEEIEGMPLKVEYISVLAQAQQQVGIGAIEKYLSFTGYAAQFFPEAPQKIDIFNAMDEVGTMLGVPQRIMLSDQQAREKVDAMAQKQQNMEAMATGMAGVSAAKDLAATPIGDTTALNQLLGV